MNPWKNKSSESGQPICPVCGEPMAWVEGALQNWEFPSDVVVDRGFWLHPECRDSEAS